MDPKNTGSDAAAAQAAGQEQVPPTAPEQGAQTAAQEDAFGMLLGNRSADEESGLPQEGARQDAGTSATQSQQPSQQLLAGRFKTVDEVVRGYQELHSFNGKLQNQVKQLVAQLGKAGIKADTSGEEDQVEKISQKVLVKLRPLMEQSDSARIEAVRTGVQKQFPDFDFDANNQALCAEFKTMDRAWLEQNPVKAALKAVKNILTEQQLMSAAQSQRLSDQQAFSEGAGSGSGINAPKSDADEVFEFAQKNSVDSIF